MTECLLCTETLTIKNVINTNCCTMPCCKDCFFKWTKVKNTCPCCRENIFCNSKENKEIMNMKELLSHRSNIISQVEGAYDELERVRARNTRVESNINQLNNEIYKKKAQFNQLLKINKGNYGLMKYVQMKIDETLDRKEEETRANNRQLMYHYKKILCLFVGANKKDNKRFKNSISFAIAIKNFIIQERKRKNREIKRQKNKYNFNKMNFSKSLCSLFYEEDHETDDEMPELEEISTRNMYQRVEDRALLRNQWVPDGLESSFREYFITQRRSRNNIMR